MGYNTTVVVLNDALTSIENDPSFGKKLAAAIREAGVGSYEPIDVSAGGHCNAALVVKTHHHSHAVTVQVGHNIGVVVGRMQEHHTANALDDGRVRELHRLSEEKSREWLRAENAEAERDHYRERWADVSQMLREVVDFASRVRPHVETKLGGAMGSTIHNLDVALERAKKMLETPVKRMADAPPRAETAKLASQDPQWIAMRLAVEVVLDDLIERGNATEINDEWAGKTVDYLIEARDKPVDFLRKHPRLPGSPLDELYPRITETK